MIRRPPRSTLFPYTNALPISVVMTERVDAFKLPGKSFELQVMGTFEVRDRSEEHTSELQSQSNLVCRLLLEKKNHAITHHGPRHSQRPRRPLAHPIHHLHPNV